MDSLLFTVLSFIVAIGILITVHEFGHFWVARKLGVKVLRFSIGFGKSLWTRRGKVDGTEYVIAAIPLGGYVKMLDERESEVPKEEIQRAFNRQSLSVRTAIVAAGPAFNFVFAILAFWLVFVSGETGTRPVVGAVADDSIAHAASFQEGDRVVAVADRKTPTWEAAVYAFLRESAEGQDLPVKVEDRDGYPQLRVLDGERLSGLGENGQILEQVGISPMRPRIPPVIGRIVSGEAADQAGLRKGDLILSVDDVALDEWKTLVSFIRKHPGKKVILEVDRDGSRLQLPLFIDHRDEGGRSYGRMGAAVEIPEGLYDEYQVEVRLGPVEALGAATYKSWDMSLFMLKMLGRMLTGEASVKNLSGPISIAQIAGRSASYGPTYFLKFLALVSISLGVLNLLPVPVLDGGHLLFFLIEALKGSPLSEEAQMQGQRIGMAILLALMGLAFYVDISRLLG